MNSELLGRITKYYRAINRLKAIGLEKVFAHNLADAAGVTAQVVRKDFSILDIKGQKRGGYQISELVNILGLLLGKGEVQNIVVIGCGRIGKALMHYSGFEPDGIKIVAGFDTDPIVYSDASQPIPMYPLNRLEEVVQALNVKACILTVPEVAASDCYDRAVSSGIRGVLNFTPITLKNTTTDEGAMVVVHNMNIALELEQILYELQFSTP